VKTKIDNMKNKIREDLNERKGKEHIIINIPKRQKKKRK